MPPPSSNTGYISEVAREVFYAIVNVRAIDIAFWVDEQMSIAVVNDDLVIVFYFHHAHEIPGTVQQYLSSS